MRTLKSLSNVELLKLARLDHENLDLTERDFYPPKDTRVIKSGVSDIYGGDRFEDYVEEFYEEYESELFDE